MTHTYGADYERSKSILKQGNNTLINRYYFLGYKKNITGSTTRFIHYNSGPTGHYRIFMAPNLPGYDIKTQYAIFKHQFIHALCMSVFPTNYSTKESEIAASTYSLEFAQKHKLRFLLDAMINSPNPIMVPLRYIRLTVMLLLISGGCQKKEESFKRFIDEDYNFTISPIGFLYIDSLVAYDTLYKYSNSPAGIRYGDYNFRTDSLTIKSFDSTYFADIMQLSEEDKEAIAQLFFKNNIFKIKDSQLYEGDVLVHPRRNSTYIRIYKNNKYLASLELAVIKSEDFNSAELSRPKNEILNVEMFKDSISNILFRKPKMKYLLDSTKYNESYKLRSHQ